MDGVCVHCGQYTAARALHGVCSIAVGAAGVGIAGAIAVESLAVWVAGADADAAGATSPLSHVSQKWLEAHLYCPPHMTWTR